MLLVQVEQQLAESKQREENSCAMAAAAQAEAHSEKQMPLLEDPAKVGNRQHAALAAASH